MLVNAFAWSTSPSTLVVGYLHTRDNARTIISIAGRAMMQLTILWHTILPHMGDFLFDVHKIIHFTHAAPFLTTVILWMAHCNVVHHCL
jgi:hypothetical protein